MQLIDLKPQQKGLDVCAGTNAIGIALLKREPTLDVHAMDRSVTMQTVGQPRAATLGFQIKSTCACARCSARYCECSSPAAISTIQT